MNTVLWQLRQWARRLGTSGLIGLVLLVAALLLQTLQVASLQRSITAQQTRLSELRQAAATPEQTPEPRSVDPLATLPPTGTAAQQIGELEQLARAHGLELPRGQYSVSPQSGTSLLRWQLVLPLDAPYPALHAFIAAALERLPNLVLDELKLKRDRIETDELQAELRLSLFVEAAP
jgi:hypothetical protein